MQSPLIERKSSKFGSQRGIVGGPRRLIRAKGHEEELNSARKGTLPFSLTEIENDSITLLERSIAKRATGTFTQSMRLVPRVFIS